MGADAEADGKCFARMKKIKIDRKELVALRESGWTLRALAQKYGCSEYTISERLGSIHRRKVKKQPKAPEELQDRPEDIARCLHCKAPQCRATGRGCPIWDT